MQTKLKTKITDPAMLAKYATHVAACRAIGLMPDHPDDYLKEFELMPAEATADILQPQPQSLPEPPRMQYPQYIAPKAESKGKQAHAETEVNR